MLGLGQWQGLGHGQAHAQGHRQGHRPSGQDDPLTPSRKARWRIYIYIYPTRSRAAYPPPRLGVNLFIFCCWRLGSLDWASWRLDWASWRLDWASWRPDWASWRPDWASWRPDWGVLGDYSVLLDGLGQIQNALGTFQEVPERETMIFHWFWKVFWGGATRAPSRRVDCPTP